MLESTAIRQQERILADSATSTSRAQVLARYRRLRQIGRSQHSAILNVIPGAAIFSQARRLGVAQGKTLILNSEDDLNYIFDLLIYTSQINRPRAIDRYIRSVKPMPGSDEAMVLEAKQRAQFAIVRCLGKHPISGLIVQDLFRDDEHWLVDENLEISLPTDAMLATRLIAFDDFVMTAGVALPVDTDFVQLAITLTPKLSRQLPADAINDRRFAETLYRLGIEIGLTEQMRYENRTVDEQ